MKVSAFSFVHNAIEAGYPIIEAVLAVRSYVDDVVIADCESTDETRQVLEKLGVTIIDGKWGNDAGQTLAEAHSLHYKCEGEVIIHFEADEVYDDSLIWKLSNLIELGYSDIEVMRLQVEQNFQRIRWYPEPVHRVFPNDGTIIKEGHTTNKHNAKKKGLISNSIFSTGLDYGYLWDITNCFRDNWLTRAENQARLWSEDTKYRMVPYHFMQPVELAIDEVKAGLQEAHWQYKQTFLELPEILKPLVGLTDYRESLAYKRLMK